MFYNQYYVKDILKDLKRELRKELMNRNGYVKVKLRFLFKK